MLPEILEACGSPVREIGSNRECLESDFERALDTPKQLLLIATCGSRDAAMQSGIARAAASQCLVCELAFDGSIHDLEDLGLPSEALSRRWDGGPDLMILPGNYLLGGPECGIILGKKDLIQSIRKLAESAGMLACRATHLLLIDAIRNTESREGWNGSPVGAVLSNSLANLENRAKRIAAQCQTPNADIVIDCKTKPCKIGSGVWHEIALPSAVLHVTPKQGIAPSRIAEHLVNYTPAIWGNVFSDHVEIVLRSVDPSEDATLVSALCSLTSETDPSDNTPSASST